MKVCCKKIFIFIFTKILWAFQLRGWRYTYFPFNFRSIDQLASVEEIWEWNFICDVLLLARFFKCIIVFHMITIFSMMNSLFLNVFDLNPKPEYPHSHLLLFNFPNDFLNPAPQSNSPKNTYAFPEEIAGFQTWSVGLLVVIAVPHHLVERKSDFVDYNFITSQYRSMYLLYSRCMT